MLFAGAEHRPGDHRCYYCGAECDDTHSTKTYVKDTFTNRDIVKFPASEYVCQGCVMSLGGGWEDLQMIDGTTKPFTTPRGMAARMYSWLIMSQPPCLALPWAQSHRFAFTKAHIATIREILVNPDMLPEPPFVVVLSDSGQKQLIFRAPVALSKDVFEVMLEDQPIRMTPAGLKERLELAAAISTKMGKPALKEIASFSFYTRAQKYGIVTELEEWAQVQHEPLSQLAAWLAPPMDKG